MAGERDLPGLGLKGYWTPGTDGWDEGMNSNLRLLSATVNLSVIGALELLPATPAEGDIYLLTTDDTIAVYDAGAWVFLTPSEGWEAWNKDVGKKFRFDGDNWSEVVDGIQEAPLTGGPFARDAGGWAPTATWTQTQIETIADVQFASGFGAAFDARSLSGGQMGQVNSAIDTSIEEALEDFVEDREILTMPPSDDWHHAIKNGEWVSFVPWNNTTFTTELGAAFPGLFTPAFSSAFGTAFGTAFDNRALSSTHRSTVQGMINTWASENAVEVPVGEAPTNGSFYARRNSEWQVVNNWTTTSLDARSLSGGQMGQVNSAIDSKLIAAGAIPEAPDDSLLYARSGKSWTSFLAWTTSRFNTAFDARNLASAHLAQVGNHVGTLSLNYAPKGPIDGVVRGIQNGVLVEISAGLPEAPNDGQIYARQSESWVIAPSGGGGGGEGETYIVPAVVVQQGLNTSGAYGNTPQAMKGNYYSVQNSQVLRGVTVPILSEFPASTYCIHIYRVAKDTNVTLGAALYVGDSMTLGTTVATTLFFAVPDIMLIGGNDYAIVVVRTDGNAAAPNPARSINTILPNNFVGMTPLSKWITHTSNTPVDAGTSFTTTNGNAMFDLIVHTSGTYPASNMPAAPPMDGKPYVMKNGGWDELTHETYPFPNPPYLPAYSSSMAGRELRVAPDGTSLEWQNPNHPLPRSSDPYGPHKYWRWRAVANVAGSTGTNNSVMVSEIEFSAQPGGSAHSTAGVTITASSRNSAPTDADRAIDSNPSTYWQSSTGSTVQGVHHLTLEFPAPISVSEVRVIQRGGSGDINTFGRFHISYSDDGVTWVIAWVSEDYGYHGSGVNTLVTSTSPHWAAAPVSQDYLLPEVLYSALPSPSPRGKQGILVGHPDSPMEVWSDGDNWRARHDRSIIT